MNPSPHGSYATEASVQHSPELPSPKETDRRLNDSDSTTDKETTKPDLVLNPDLIKGKWDMFAEADSFHATQHVINTIFINFFVIKLNNECLNNM